MNTLLKTLENVSEHRKRNIKRAITGFFFAAMFSVIPFMIDTAAEAYLKYIVQVDDVFVYHKVEPVNLQNGRTIPLSMMSESTWYEQNGQVTWNDVLRCEVGGLISEQTTFDLNFIPPRPLGERGSGVWQYNGELPETANICTIRSTIRWCYDHLNNPVCKEQTINSEPIVFTGN